MYAALLQGKLLTKEQCIMVKSSLTIKGWVEAMFLQATSVMAQNSIKFHAICSRRSSCIPAQCLDIWMLPGLVQYRFSTYTCPFSCGGLCIPAKKRMGKIPMDACIQISLVEEIFPNEPWLLFSPLLTQSG